MRGLRSMSLCALIAVSMQAGGASPQGTASEWRALIDDAGAAGWRNVGKASLDPRWRIVEGALVLTPGGGDIITRETWGDFELEFEWKLPAGGNSGLFYRAVEAEPIWARAVEYQLLDDEAAEDRFMPTHRAGAVYDLVAPSAQMTRPAGEFNRSRVVACGSRVEHWLNGARVAAYDADSKDWHARVSASKFAGQSGFASARRGHIGLQDHGDAVHVRAMRIRALARCGGQP